MSISEPPFFLPPDPACFALLDDRDATADDPRSRLYEEHAGTLSCADAGLLPEVFARLQDGLAQGLHAVGLFSYELGAQMHGIAPRADEGFPSQILLFRRCTRLAADAVGAWLDARSDGSGRGNASAAPAGIGAVAANVDEAAFTRAIERIHAYIEAGDTYQINYTYRLRFAAYGAPAALYRRLRARQPVPYGALVILPGGAAVLSLSPELFVRHRDGEITARPMKGTAAASGDDRIDAERAAALAADPKNCAENLMIVDLLRNDLGRIAQTGTVRVPKLFEVTRFSSVLQMTSTVQARLRGDVALHDVFRALYPCGSITGAPKRRTMQIIRELEPAARGLYTGAIAWFEAPAAGRVLGDFCMSVPIRTMVLQPERDGLRAGEMGVGAGIVHDSVAADEFEECRLKARFLTGLGHDFSLFETIRATREEGCSHLERHLARLRASAAAFGFPFDDAAIRAVLDAELAQCAPGRTWRLRLELAPDGRCSIARGELAEIAQPVTLLPAPQPTVADDPFLRHKTTVRDRYDAAWREAERQGAFDMLFFNRDGMLTEGARSNVFVRIDGRWCTPPLSAGLLPGVMRSVLLADPAWQAIERDITADDLRRAEEVVVCNALRGVLRARVAWPDA